MRLVQALSYTTKCSYAGINLHQLEMISMSFFFSKLLNLASALHCVIYFNLWHVSSTQCVFKFRFFPVVSVCYRRSRGHKFLRKLKNNCTITFGFCRCCCLGVLCVRTRPRACVCVFLFFSLFFFLTSKCRIFTMLLTLYLIRFPIS